MTLYVHTFGHGPELVLLHGWGFNQMVWHDIAAKLATDWKITLIDLPGHGKSRYPAEGYDLDQLVGEIKTYVTKPCHLLGWSLGGMAAIQLAQLYPHIINNLTLVSTTPQFITDSHWPYGVAPAVLENFADSLIKNYEQTINRFLSLQTQGRKQDRQVLKTLKNQLNQGGHPDIRALNDGCQILLKSRLQKTISSLTCSVNIIHGGKDRLIPPSAAKACQQIVPQAELEIIDDAGHIPFITDQDVFIQILNRTLTTISNDA